MSPTRLVIATLACVGCAGTTVHRVAEPVPAQARARINELGSRGSVEIALRPSRGETTAAAAEPREVEADRLWLVGDVLHYSHGGVQSTLATAAVSEIRLRGSTAQGVGDGVVRGALAGAGIGALILLGAGGPHGHDHESCEFWCPTPSENAVLGGALGLVVGAIIGGIAGGIQGHQEVFRF